MFEKSQLWPHILFRIVISRVTVRKCDYEWSMNDDEDNNIARTNCFSKHLLGWELWVMACHRCFTSPEPKEGREVTAVSTTTFTKKAHLKQYRRFRGKLTIL
jgi:hypothetical protein